MKTVSLPRILVIDDLYGRSPPNRDREDLCVRLGLKDVTETVGGLGSLEDIPNPIAEVVFCRGQLESNGSAENDLPGILKIVRHGWQTYPRWALVLLDLHFKTGVIGSDGEPIGRDADRDPRHYFGLRILESLRREFPELPVAILSAMEKSAVSETYADLEAVGFLAREEVNREKLAYYLFQNGLLEDNRSLSDAEERYRILGHSLPLLLALRDARRLARGNGNLLLLGETGTGKELLAHYIHAVSPCQDGPFQVLFTQETTESIFEDKLFGHVKGAFTGATEAKAGAAELAKGGTLFIDEFGDIPLTLQGKFLRLLDEKTREVQRQGSNRTIHLDLQVVLAANSDMKVLENSGGFRSDLMHRIRRGRITLPPLRERREDIPMLVGEFARRAVKHYRALPRDVTPSAMDVMMNAPWPGNIRELQEVIEDAVRRFPDVEHLVPAHLQIKAARTSLYVARPAAPDPGVEGDTIQDLDALIRQIEAFSFADNYAALRGKLPDIQRAFARFLARYLKAALLCPAIRKFSPDDPEGENNITGAVKCLTGQTKLSTSKAAAIVKKLLQSDPEVIHEVQQDPILHAVYKKAIRLRPKESTRGTPK